MIEIVIRNGPDATREDVPTFAERKEMREETARRKAADEKVNWKRRRIPARPPSFAYGEPTDAATSSSMGCRQAVPKRSPSGRADEPWICRSQLARSTFPIPDAELEVVADVYEYPQRWWYCSDLQRSSDARPSTWRAVGGTLTIQLAPPSRVQGSRGYQATIQLDNAEFVGPTGVTRAVSWIHPADGARRPPWQCRVSSFVLTALPDRKP